MGSHLDIGNIFFVDVFENVTVSVFCIVYVSICVIIYIIKILWLMIISSDFSVFSQLRII